MQDTGNSRNRRLLVFALAVLALTGAMGGLGWLITHTFAHVWPFTVEDGANRAFASHRTHTLNRVTAVFSTGASTPYAIAITACAVLVAALIFRGWREPLFLGGVVALETTVFLLATLMVDRGRPLVPHLDAAPPTSSFPSGHTAAALALYGGIAVLAQRAGAKWPVWVLVLIPLAVGTSRVYRGMHHPSDVVAALLLGTACLVIMNLTVLHDSPSPRLGRTAPRRIPSGRSS